MAAQPDYPPPPWRLNAAAYISLWRMPTAQFVLALGASIRPIQLSHHVLLAAGFVFYDRGSDLEYNEVFLAVVTRAAGRIGITVPLIWVDSPTSLRAGRELWGIPKQPATIDGADRSPMSATDLHRQTIAELRFRKGSAVPLRIPLRVAVLQQVGQAVQRTAIAASTSIEFGTAEWSIPPGSPLQLLQGRRPLISMKLPNARIRFGA